jgi:ATP-binding cassette subfamily B protein
MSEAVRDSVFPDAPAPGTRWRLVRRALAFAVPHRVAVVGILALTLTAAAMAAIEPLVLRSILDSLAAGHGFASALGGIAALAVIALLREIHAGAATWLTWRTRLRIQFSLLGATVERLHRLPLDFHKTEGVGATMTRLDRGIQGFMSALGELAFNLVPAIAYLTFAVIVMLELDARLAILVLVFAPLPGLIAGLAAPAQTRREQRLLERWTRIYSRFNEVLSGLVTVRSFAMEDAEKERFLGRVSEANELVVRGVGYDARVGLAQGAIVVVARLAAIGLGALLVARGEITIGTLVAFLGYVGGVFGPAQSLAGIYKTLRTASVSLDVIFGILDAQEHLGDAEGAIDLPAVRGEVSFESVRFGYRQERTPILDGIDVDVLAGEHVALVGPSGSGKSTMMALLQRFYDPWEGAVRLDGVDLRGLRQSSLRANIGVVLQEPVLWNDTVAANIAYGRPDASSAQIHAAARAAHVEEVVARLPRGYDTLIGERGALLSVGERQRLAIARAILKDPPILIFDEATSALDAESEAYVQHAIERLARGRTTFIIAHRLATVVRADRILVLRHGRIAETGTHERLLQSGGYYASLVAKQSMGLLPDAGATSRG